MTRLIACIAALMIIFAFPMPVQSSLEVPLSAQTSLDEQIDAWVKTLSKEDGFEAWRDAGWRKYPLGPGQHGWVVIMIGKGSEELGYLVALSSPNGELIVGEYGLGESPLFSLETLQRALSSEALENIRFSERAVFERVYVDAIHAFWKVSEDGITRYADGKTGMWLPIGEQDVNRLQAAPAAKPHAMTGERRHVLAEPADPYATLTWLGAPNAAVNGWGQMEDLVQQRSGELIYIAEAFDGKAPNPFGVAGYHWWAAGSFVALDHDGLRYIPLPSLLGNGSFQ